MHLSRLVAGLATTLSATLILSACGSGGGSDAGSPPAASPRSTPPALLALKNFQSGCADFVDYAAEALTEEYLQQFSCGFGAICPIFLGPPGVPPDAAAPGAGAANGAPDRVSDTNVQEAGVDEADIVKTDSAGRLYILSGTTLSILEAFPPAGLAERALVTLDLAANDDGFFAEDLFLDEAQRRVVVLGGSFGEVSSSAVSVIIDISNPAAPQETARLGVDGFGLEARRIGSRVHRVSRFDVVRPDWFFAPEDALQARRDAYFAERDGGRDAAAAGIKAEVRAEVGRRVAAAGASALLPQTFRQTAAGARTSATLDCTAISRPDVTTGLGLALVDSFNVDGSARATSGVVNNAYLVYASPTNLYLAQSSAGWFFAPNQSEETVVYRLALSATGAAAYQALGKVPGSVRDSYAMSEHAGFLRVASTENDFSLGRNSSTSGLRVLDAAALGEMPIVGSVSGLAPGETIQGARLLGERGFLVTFRQIDPLFALDLSDPRNPRVASELKIPGFSSYLMPVGENHLLTVGRDGTDEGLTGAVAVQLFDVRDLAAVRQVAVLTPAAGGAGYSYSAAENDPHAFSYFPDSLAAAAPGTLTLPLTAYSEDPQSAFTGFLVIRVAPDSATPLRETGRIDHDQFLQDRDFCGGIDGDFCAPAYGLAEPRRAVYMQSGADTFLYTISAVGVLANSAADPNLNLGSRRLPYDPPCCFAIGGGDGVTSGPAGPAVPARQSASVNKNAGEHFVYR